MSVDSDSLSRTLKIFLDSNEVSSVEEGKTLLADFKLQVHLGTGLQGNRSRQAAALTVINSAARAFEGGVLVAIAEDVIVEVGWHSGMRLSEAVRYHRGVIVDHITDAHPTICVGDTATDIPGRVVLRATFDGWAAGVVEGTVTPLAERGDFVPAGIAAGGIAVGEAFEFRRGTDPYAGRRSQGMSLWQPGIGWLDPAARGPEDVGYAPSKWWMVGLGHLGQGYLWNIGMLSYREPNKVHLLLQDDDPVTVSNESTGLLLSPGTSGMKTRVLSSILEQRGFRTTITERRLNPGDGPVGDEPRLALIGVDNPETRRGLSDHGFGWVIDAGLGGGPTHYRGFQLHTFVPGGSHSREVAAWKQDRVTDDRLLDLPAYRRMTEADGDRCGTVEVAGKTVAAAFVGATAGALAIAEAIRTIQGGQRYAVVDVTLRDLATIRRVEATEPVDNTGFGYLE